MLCLLELAEMRDSGAGERSFFVAEQFGLDQFGGNGGAIERDEGSRGARAAFMQGAGDKLFARASFAHDATRVSLDATRSICVITPRMALPSTRFHVFPNGWLEVEILALPTGPV